MKKSILKNKALIAVVVSSIVLTTTYIAKASDFEPGSKDDPIITKSYLDDQISKIKEYLDDKLRLFKEDKEFAETINGNSSSLEIVEIKKGQKIILHEGSQIILRAGKASIIDSEQGGIADLTKGVDLVKGQLVPKNHLLMVPRSDGRGVEGLTDSIFMVIGAYDIN
ncbi:hypothetical protein [Tepidibacter thalassicus]|uniref:Uncharacterized protein n=1 Tax=Tepidibacter thalassicus DSM 15285 TaxID=1123350 RepID=A0A1M5TD17_9FIRM|nr:hypothetical protein [Tepidibacter thalassicus]SHH48608.1 hypothetical protein SAMN02744040_02121 [Tepidibacter thalassicus DSM 15285]